MDVNDSVVRWNVFIDNQNQNKTAHTVNQLNTLASMMVVNSFSDRLDAYLNTSHTLHLATKKTPRATKLLLNNAKQTHAAVDVPDVPAIREWSGQAP